MGWGARQWLQLMPETTYGTFDSGGTPIYPRLDGDTAWNVIPTPRTHAIRDAAGGNRKVQNVSSVTTYSGTLKTPLYPTQAAAILGLAATLTSNQLGSFSGTFYDTVRVRRFLGGKIDSAKISCSADQAEGMLMLELAMTFQTIAGSDPTFTEPSYSVYPTELPYTFKQSSTGFSVGGATRTKYNSFSCNIQNILAKTVDELGYISGINYCGRNVDFATNFQYTANTDQGNYESQSALDCQIAFTHSSNVLTLDFNANGRMKTRTRTLPLGDVAREAYTIEAFYDSTATTDFSFSVV